MLSDSGVKLNNDISETSVKELITQLAENNSLNSDNFQKIINSGSFREILHAVINDTMKLTPKDIQEGEEAVSSYYKRIRKNVENIENSLKSAGNSAPELSKSLSDIKSNIDFMNDLNKNMTYFQMPVKFSKSEGNGELYVFTNKKNLAGKTDNIYLSKPEKDPKAIAASGEVCSYRSRNVLRTLLGSGTRHPIIFVSNKSLYTILFSAMRPFSYA